MKYYFISILLFFYFYQTDGQSVAPDCVKDSLGYKIARDYLDTCNINYIDFLLYERIVTDIGRDRSCDLIVYAQIFNSLLERGLNINYSYSQNPPTRITKADIDMNPELQSQVEKFNNNIFQYQIYWCFLLYKERFEKSVLTKYEGAFSVLEKDVKYIVKYGALSYPTEVNDILLSKNKNLTRSKLLEESLKSQGQQSKN
jgi:hypothetical protein